VSGCGQDPVLLLLAPALLLNLIESLHLLGTHLRLLNPRLRVGFRVQDMGFREDSSTSLPSGMRVHHAWWQHCVSTTTGVCTRTSQLYWTDTVAAPTRPEILPSGNIKPQRTASSHQTPGALNGSLC
jgi:hypothetical protein